MPGPESLWHWLAQSALVGSVLSAIGCVGVLACRQPVKRLRLIELTLAACLLAPLIGTLPGWPTWPLPWLAGGAPVGAAVLDEPTIPDESLVPAPVAEAHAPRLADGPAFDQQVASAETGSEAGGDLAADESDAGLPAFDEPFWEEAEFLVADESGDAPAAGIREKLPRLLVAVYFAMLALLSLRGALGIFGLWRLHRSAAAAPACCGERLAEIAGPGGRRVRRVRLLLSDRIDAPVTYLWGRPVIVLPRRMCPGERGASASRWRPHESGDHGIGDPPAGSRPPLARHVDFALAHEWSHIERGDLWTWYLAAAAQWVFCYQPLVWWLRRQMRLCQDFLADASAARHGGDDAADYAEFLVRLARGRLYSPAAPALGVIDRRSHLHRRIAMLLEHRRWIEPRCRRGWTLTAAALALALTAGGSMLRLQADTAPAAPVAELPKQAAPEPPPSVDSPGIREIVDEAIKATGTRSGLPALLARAGEVRAALELAERMPKKSDELSAIAAAQARAGDRAGAIETAASIGDDSERNRAFVRIAETVAERGDPTAVAEILPRITNPDGKAQVLFRIAELHAERGDVQGVVDTAVKVVDATSSAGIAAYNAGRTPWDAAMSAVGASRTRTNVLVARAFVKAGKIDAALDTLGRIEDEYLKFPVVLDIARIRAERGDLDAALQTAETIEAPIYKASVLASLAEFLFDRAKPAGAREVLDKALAVEVPPGGGYAGYPNDAYASHVLQTAAVVQMKLGDRDAARKTFRKAVNSIIPQNRRLVIEAQAQAGDIEGALENARLHVRHAGGVAMQSYELIAVVQAKAGDFDGALATAERSEAVATGASATALAQVAAAQRAAGQFDEAAATFRRAVEIVPNRGGRALHMVAYHQAKAGDAKTAFEWARAEPDNAVRTAALRGVALGILERREA
ncbi:MAG: M56 family metallopeptidase, partial [Planctomycetales bacterium]